MISNRVSSMTRQWQGHEGAEGAEEDEVRGTITLTR